MDGEGTATETLPEALDEWVERRAAELDTDREGVLTRAVVALRTIEDEADASLAASEAPTADDLGRFDDRVADLENDFDAKLTDVRERVVQVKREADEKAAADHDHPDLRDAVVDAGRAAATATDRTGEFDEALDELDDRVTAGFDNYEEVLSYLTDAADETASKLDTTARTLLDLRSRVAALEADAARTAVTANIRTEANRRGVTVARCKSCGGTVSLGLLDDPTCPHCEASFDGLGSDPGFLKKPQLTTGTPPALTAADDADPPETPAELFDVNSPDGSEAVYDD